eukprot:gnl/TRDRNA2_/TRDRNA2_189892_c0_seq1.p1 gnl/TRDRNA2_/TRDRNA2_189892_c0~~gnl/TRDRNA2_/TRDRNA2_189892_c0_seq1.p1  ORF type:complete len:481 (+),score=43.76 gnl/TRDRNA2_/TRDRNA2_189892_c0_seq1:40-1482(+)
MMEMSQDETHRRARPQSARSGGVAVAGVGCGHEWIPGYREWQRVEAHGRVKKPKLAADEYRLNHLFANCRLANFREVKAIVTHFPYMLALTDSYGFSALHHAEMSADPEFVRKLLGLYHDPKTFTRKFVTYHTEEDLRDDALDLQRAGRNRSDEVVVGQVGPHSLAAKSGVVAGDKLECINPDGDIASSFDAQGQQDLPTPDDILEMVTPADGGAGGAAGSGGGHGIGFPLTLEFRGPACLEILGHDGWTPLHSAAGGGRHYRKALQELQKARCSQQGSAQAAAKDVKGCTWEHWSLINRRCTASHPRRPLSAGTRNQPTLRRERGGQSRDTARELAAAANEKLASEQQNQSLLARRLAASRQRPPAAAAGGRVTPSRVPTATPSGSPSHRASGSLAARSRPASARAHTDRMSSAAMRALETVTPEGVCERYMLLPPAPPCMLEASAFGSSSTRTEARTAARTVSMLPRAPPVAPAISVC